MTWKFSIDWEPDQLLMVVRCQGLWTLQDAQDFQTGILNMLALQKVDIFDMLVDLGLGLTQTAEVAARLMVVDEQFMKHGLRRRGAFTQSAIVRSQVSRLVAGKQDSRIFADEETARAWLLSLRQADISAAELTHP
jgi:hypothetical protein